MSKIDPNKLLISSDFYTVQGEGISSGIPSYFVRLGICNLTCGMSRAFTNMLMKEKRIDGKPTGFLRGLSWNAKGIIMDEAQNSTFRELVTLLTRVGHFSKLFVCGDPMQSDINGKSGFEKMCNVFNDAESKEKGIHVFYLTEEDIVRSEIVRYIVKKLELYNKKG